LQIVNYDRYMTESNDNRISVIPLPPERGTIIDRNGVVLARNLPSYTLEICQCRTEDVPNGTLKVYQSGLNKRAVEALDSSLFNPYFNVRQNWGDGRSAA